MSPPVGYKSLFARQPGAGDATDQRDDRLDHRGRPFSGIPDDQQYSNAVDVVSFKSIPQLFSCLLLNGFSLY